jgi:hypothetical protein
MLGNDLSYRDVAIRTIDKVTVLMKADNKQMCVYVCADVNKGYKENEVR